MKVGLVGNQNSGKTTIFNCLTGMNAKIGNWPGVTIEKKSGIIRNTKHEITDLPGIYSLSPYSLEEDVARKYIFEEHPDVIINIVDATSLERSLYLTTQLMELDTKVIVALNMCDILEKKGIYIDTKKLEQMLGVKIFKISALKEIGIDELVAEIDRIEDYKRANIYDKKIEDAILNINKNVNEEHSRFISVKLLENDERFKKYKNDAVQNIVNKILSEYDTDLEEVIATERYDFIETVKLLTFKKTKVKESQSYKLDRIFLNKWLAFPIFAIIMFLVYYLSVGVVGAATTNFMGNAVEGLSKGVENILNNMYASDWVISLVVDGIISGVGSILGFIPQLTILFLCIALLETTGYMARIALLLDKTFSKIGLSGKSLIPFIVGSGCSVPGIMGTRIIENQKEREITSVLVPFIPCSAKLPIIALFSGYFFKENSGLVSASLYFLAIVIIIVSAFGISRLTGNTKKNTFISELPEYKVPNAKYLAREVIDKVSSFIKRAGSVILVCSVIIWFLLSFSFKLEYGVNIENSILADIGRLISWIFYPMIGQNNWGATVSAIQGLVAKEQVVSSMAVISGLAENAKSSSEIFASGTLFSSFTGASAYAFMIFNLFSAPCFGAIGAMKKELGSKKKLICAVSFQTILAWILATIVYQIGRRIEIGSLKAADIAILVSIILVIIIILIKKLNNKNRGCAECPYCDSCNKNVIKM